MSSQEHFETVLREWATLFMHRSMRGHVRYMRERGLSRSMLGTLYFLNHHGNAGVSDLGQHLGVSNAAVSQMVERLVEEGMIERVEDPDDRRMKKITLTQQGIIVMKESVDARLNWIGSLTNDLTYEEIGEIASAIQIMIDKVRELYPYADQHNHDERSTT